MERFMDLVRKPFFFVCACVPALVLVINKNNFMGVLIWVHMK